MKKIIALILAALMAVFAFAGCGGASSSSSEGSSDSGESSKADTNSDWGYIQNKGKMTIGITLFEPMNYKDKDSGELTGFETEFTKAVCEELGVEPDFQVINWETKEVELKSKKIDCIWNGFTINEDRQKEMDFSTPYMENRQVMVCKKDNVDKYAQSVKDAKVIAEKESAGEEVAQGDEYFKEANYTPADSQAKALMEVKAGTSDVAIIDFVMSKGTIRDDSDYSDLAVIEAKTFAPEQYGIGFRKDSPETVEKVNAAIKKLKENGKLDEIAKKYNLQDLLIVK